MSNVGSVSSVRTSAPIPRAAHVAAECNDPVQRVDVRGNQLNISGTATNRGFAPSSLSLTVDGKKTSVPLNGGQTPMATFEALKKKLPAGYEAKLIGAEDRPGGNVLLEIEKKQAKFVSVSKIPMNIVANGGNASVDASLWVNEMRGPARPRRVIGEVDVLATGAGFADALPKYKVASISVYEQGTNKLVGTFKNPRMKEGETTWAQRTLSYRFELAESLDMKKKYTVVVSTGINGSKPHLVRSVYLPISKV